MIQRLFSRGVYNERLKIPPPLRTSTANTSGSSVVIRAVEALKGRKRRKDRVGDGRAVDVGTSLGRHDRRGTAGCGLNRVKQVLSKVTGETLLCSPRRPEESSIQSNCGTRRTTIGTTNGIVMSRTGCF